MNLDVQNFIKNENNYLHKSNKNKGEKVNQSDGRLNK
jgi:hypothetical protein